MVAELDENKIHQSSTYAENLIEEHKINQLFVVGGNVFRYYGGRAVSYTHLTLPTIYSV